MVFGVMQPSRQNPARSVYASTEDSYFVLCGDPRSESAYVHRIFSVLATRSAIPAVAVLSNKRQAQFQIIVFDHAECGQICAS